MSVLPATFCLRFFVVVLVPTDKPSRCLSLNVYFNKQYTEKVAETLEMYPIRMWAELPTFLTEVEYYSLLGCCAV
jgi:hypothetical protein